MGHFKRDAHKTGDGDESAENSKLGAGIPSPWYVFGRFEQGLQDNQLNFIENHICSYKLFEQMMGFQYFLNNEITNAYNRRQTPKNLSDQILTDESVMAILQQNILYLFSALRPLEQGSVHAYCALVRPVLESVHKCFFLMKHPESTRKFLLSETYDAWKRTQQYEKSPATPQAFLESDAAQWALRGRKITPDEFNKFRDSHTNHRIRAKIYKTDTLRHQHSFYCNDPKYDPQIRAGPKCI